MHTIAWLMVLQQWREQAVQAGRPALVNALWDATEELSYLHHCDQGLNPSHFVMR